MQSWDTGKSFRWESSSFQMQAQFINRSLHNSSLYFHLSTSNQSFPVEENFENPTKRPRVARWIFCADLDNISNGYIFTRQCPFLSALKQGQIFSRPSFPKSFGKILFLSPPASAQRILVLERANTAFPNASEIWAIWGLNIHLVFFCSRASWILLWFHALMDSLSSRSPPVKLVPLSDLISLAWPLLPINRLNAIKWKSVSKLCAIFMCSARIAKHVEIPTDVGRKGWSLRSQTI